jgi:uncharacterized membrane protein
LIEVVLTVIFFTCAVIYARLTRSKAIKTA